LTQVLHRAAGLSVRAARVIPGLPVCQSDQRPSDVCIHLGAPAPWSEFATDVVHTAKQTSDTGEPLVRVGRNDFGFHFEYADRTQMWIDATAQNVWCTWAPNATLEDTATYLTGPVLGLVLRLRGALALHASAVQVGDAAVMLVGGHGAGKSTAAAALARRGCPVITDDVLHLRRDGSHWLAEPFGALLRLWPDGGALALGADVVLPRLTPSWDKRQLALDSRGVRGAERAVPLGGIVFLEPREESADVPRLDPIIPSDTLLRLAVHSSSSHLIDDAMRAREFQAIGDITRRYPAVRATASASASHFDAFISAVLEWARSMLTPDPCP
jgi:hypothetical protein